MEHRTKLNAKIVSGPDDQGDYFVVFGDRDGIAMYMTAEQITAAGGSLPSKMVSVMLPEDVVKKIAKYGWDVVADHDGEIAEAIRDQFLA